MSDKIYLKAELRATREELAHPDLAKHVVTDVSLLSPPMDIQFVRITHLSDEQLKQHEEHLVRDLQDLDLDNPNQLYRPTNLGIDEPSETK